MSDTLSAGSLKGTARYTWGGDEFLFVEISESMSLAANFKVNVHGHQARRPGSCPA